MATELTIDNRSRWSQAKFWTEVCPHLSIDSHETPRLPRATDEEQPTTGKDSTKKAQIREHGFVLIDEPIIDLTCIDALRKGIECLRARGLPASYILLFDEAWHLAQQSQRILRQSTNPRCQLHMDLLAWCIDDAGFSPHRDRALSLAFDEETRDPLFVTHWIALSDATPTNSCLYVIPAECDPGYWDGDDNAADPLQRALPNKNSYSKAIRAVPRKQGQSILFSHRLIHWGSARCSSTDEPPRMAISFVFTDHSVVESSYLKEQHSVSDTDSIPFSTRLALVCGQMLAYYQRFEPSMDMLSACHEYSQQASCLSDSYKKLTHLEYLKVSRERGFVDSDQEEELMDAMLDRQDDFDDDFCEMQGSDVDRYDTTSEGTNDDDDINEPTAKRTCIGLSKRD